MAVPTAAAATTFGGTLRAGDSFSVTITVGAGPAAPTVTVSTTAQGELRAADGTLLRAADTAQSVAAALAALINDSADPDAAAFSAAARDGSVFVVKREGTTAFTLAATATQQAAASIGAGTAAVGGRDAGGSGVVAGETWVLTLAAANSVATYRVAAANTSLATLLADLARLVNADAGGAYVADVAGTQLLLFRGDGAAITATLAVEAAGVAAIDPGTARSMTIALNGNPVAGETWTLTLAGRTHAEQVGNADSLAAVAARLAARVNLDANLAEFSAAGAGAGLVLVQRNGAAFDATLSVAPTTPRAVAPVVSQSQLTLFGHPLAGEVWRVELANRSFAVTAAASGPAAQAGIADALAQAIRADNSTQGVVARLAAAIDDRAGFDTQVSGGNLIINRAGGSITAALRNGAGVVISRVTSAAPSLTLSFAGAGIALGETWTVEITQGGITASFAETARYSAAVSGNALLVSDHTGAVLAPRLAITHVSSFAVDTTRPIAFMGEFDSTPTNSHTWRLTLTGPSGPAAVLALPINAALGTTVAERQANIAQAFALLVNASGPAALTAVAEGRQLVIVARDGSIWKAAFSIDPAPASAPISVSAGTRGATTVTFAGTPQPREIWSLTIGALLPNLSNRISVSIGEITMVDGQAVIADSLVSLARIFAARFNDPASGLAGFKAIAAGNAIVILNSGNGFARFDTSFRFVPAVDATVELYEVAEAVGGAASIKFSGNPVDGEKWLLTLNPAGGSANPHIYYAQRGDSVRDVALALAARVNAAAGYVASVEGDRLVLVSTATAAGSFSAVVTVTAADDRNSVPPAAGSSVALVPVATAPRAWTAQLAGTPLATEVWRVSLNGVDYDHTVLAGQATAEVAAALARLVTLANTSFAATTEDRTLIIFGAGGGAAPAVSFSIVGKPGDLRFAATTPSLAGAAATTTLTSVGPLPQNVTYVVLIKVGNVGTQFSTITGSADTAEQVLAALAASINVNAADDFTAVADGTTLYVVNRAGTAFGLANAAETAAPARASVITLKAANPALPTLFVGEVWTVLLDDSTFSTVHSYVVKAGETLADVARELAKNIGAGAVVSITASASGDQLFITNLDNTAFAASIEVTPVGQVSIIETRKFNQAAAGNQYFYRPVNLNTRVDESVQVDTLNVSNAGSPANDVGVLTATQLTGLGMAGDTVIAGRILPGGIVYRDLEVLNIALGAGNDTFTIVSTHTGATNIVASAGNDVIHVQSIDGHTSIDGQAGDDEFRVGSAAAPNLLLPETQNRLQTLRALLTIIGGAGNDSLFIDDRATTAGGEGILTGSALTGFGMPSVSEVQTIRVQSAAGSYVLAIADRTIDSTTASTVMLQLSGTPIGPQAGLAGDTWSILIDDLPRYDYVVPNNTVGVADIARELATLINTRTVNGARAFTAAADAETILIVSPTGRGFQAAFQLRTSATAPTAGATVVRRATAVATLSGTPVAGDRWEFTVSGSTYGITIDGASTLAGIATALAQAINAAPPAGTYFAAAIGNAVVVTDRAVTPVEPRVSLAIRLAGSAGVGGAITVGRDTTTSVALTLGGSAVVGEEWFVRLGNVDYFANVRAPILDVAEGLAAALAVLPGTYTASAAGNVLSINPNGLAFRATVTRS